MFSDKMEGDSLQRHYRYDKVALVFDRLDVGGNGSISFAEYLTQIEKLLPEEVEAARAAFDLLGPDKDGNVRKRKYIEMQIEAFEDVLDSEFERWVQIMTKGTTVHAHRRKDLLASGVKIPEDYIDPPSNNIFRKAYRLSLLFVKRMYIIFFSNYERRRIAAYESSANARRKHIKRIQDLRRKLDEHDKTLLDEEHAMGISMLEEKARLKGTLLPPKERKRKGNDVNNKKRGRRGNPDTSGPREEKELEEGPQRGLKKGNEPAPLMYESTNMRLRRARELERFEMEERIADDLFEQQLEQEVEHEK